METEIQNILDSFADVRKRANANACFGKPMVAEGRMVIPVAEVTYGFTLGTEGGHTAGEEREASGGMRVRPFAIIEVTPDGTRVEPLVNEQKLAWVGGLLIAWVVFWLAWALTRIFSRHE